MQVKKPEVAEITTMEVTSTITGLTADSRLAGGRGVHWVRRALAIVRLKPRCGDPVTPHRLMAGTDRAVSPGP